MTHEEIYSWQRLDKRVSTAKNTDANIEEIVGNDVFYVVRASTLGDTDGQLPNSYSGRYTQSKVIS
jgi:hypothetical protein